ncbi:MAG: nucleotidyl transferase AbiEii/AbiGii toxin family protein, partial [Nocardioidaceae bacterium]
ATALLARQLGVRHTLDLDVYRAVAHDQAERDFRRAAATDLGDWFGFEPGRSIPVADASTGIRLPVTAHIGTIEWVRFHVDITAESVRMTAPADDVPPLIAVAIPGLNRPGYRAYPLVDHIADKTCAILERHGPARRPSTRFKDLVDLVALTGHAGVSAAAQRRALQSEATRRRLDLPDRFSVPDHKLWESGYAAEAARAVAVPAPTLQQALTLVCPFIDPLLANTADGNWDPKHGAWRP